MEEDMESVILSLCFERSFSTVLPDSSFSRCIPWRHRGRVSPATILPGNSNPPDNRDPLPQWEKFHPGSQSRICPLRIHSSPPAAPRWHVSPFLTRIYGD